jgi:hypothetical protein
MFYDCSCIPPLSKSDPTAQPGEIKSRSNEDFGSLTVDGGLREDFAWTASQVS